MIHLLKQQATSGNAHDLTQPNVFFRSNSAHFLAITIPQMCTQRTNNCYTCQCHYFSHAQHVQHVRTQILLFFRKPHPHLDPVPSCSSTQGCMGNAAALTPRIRVSVSGMPCRWVPAVVLHVPYVQRPGLCEERRKDSQKTLCKAPIKAGHMLIQARFSDLPVRRQRRTRKVAVSSRLKFLNCIGL